MVSDGYVTDDSGTGIVHQAPGFGEDDYRVCIANGVVMKGETVPCPVDESGCFTAEVRDFVGQRFNLLLCSTIIETGIDVPSANTIIMSRADKFGLAQLHG